LRVDGIKRLRQAATDKAHIKALDDCWKWLNKPVWTVTSATVVPQIKTAEGLVSHHVCGFRRDNHKIHVSMIVDADDNNIMRSPHAIAEEIAGPEYCFHAASNINHLVPDSAKNRLFTSEEELYVAAPQLRPHQPRRAAR
jgi:hypothetical protein